MSVETSKQISITGRNNLRCLPPHSSPPFRSNLTRQDTKSPSVTNTHHSLPSLHISCVKIYICHLSLVLSTSWTQVTFFSWSQNSTTAISVTAQYRLTTSPSHRTVPSDAACECLRSSMQSRIVLPSLKSYNTREHKLERMITFIHTHTLPLASPLACHSIQI